MKLRPVLFFIISIALLLGLQTAAFAQEEKPAEEKKDLLSAAQKALGADPQAVKAIEEKEKQTKAAIKQKTEALQEVQTEAEKAIEEKNEIERKAELKEQTLLALEKEISALKKEAGAAGSSEAKKRFKQLKAEFKAIKQEAEAHKEKLLAAGEKVEAAQKQLTAEQEQILKHQKELLKLKKAKTQKKGWLGQVVNSAGIVLIGAFLFLFLTLLLRKIERAISPKDVLRESETALRLKTLLAILQWMGNIAIFCIVAYMLLESFGINMAPFLAGAGILGLAFGFGGQYLIRDLINGIFILVEGQYRINDVVKIGSHGGLVESVNLRVTRLRDLEGRVIYIPNGEVKSVVNFTQEYAYAVLDIGVAYKENVDKVIEVIKAEAEKLKEDSYFRRLILDELEMFGVDELADSQVTIKCRIKTLPIKQWEVAREFRRRIKNRFDELGIEIPFPHRTLYWGTGTDNQWFKEWAARQAKG